jgi:NADH-quinone oxidoreductase subunit L
MLLPLIPLLPLLGFLFNFTIGVRVLSKGSDSHGGGHGEDHPHPSPVVGAVACLTVLLSFLLACVSVLRAHAAPGGILVETLGTWIPGGDAQTIQGSLPFHVDWAYQLDALSSVMVLVVTFVGFLIHVYSTGYMAHDPGYARFMSYLNLFMFAMLTLVLAANYAVLFVGWEGVGLCSYLLIGFWFEKKSATDAGKKAFIVNRIGDASFVLGMFLIFTTFGSLDFRAVAEGVSRLGVDTSWGGTLTLIGLLLFGGACGKSAQIPLYVWLPDAMEGPTPVSALIHAATMVTAGVYMVARSGALYSRAPLALFVVALVGAATAIFAASIGLVQNDIKRVLAYSTVSQLGYMFLACGVGAYTAAIFHLGTHAFFKALLFLGSGSVIHGMSGEQDMQKMGGLRSKMPTTHWTMLVGCVAIAGIPPLAGFFSKDEILWSAYRVGGYGQLVWGVGLLAAALTAFYMFRLYFLTFWGSFRGTEEQAHHLHESPPSMTVPLVVLAIGSAVTGFLGLPKVFQMGSVIEGFLEPVFESSQGALARVFAGAQEGGSIEFALMGVSVLVAGAGIAVAVVMYLRSPGLADSLERALPGVHRVLFHKYYVDELYDRVFVRGLGLGLGDVFFRMDQTFVDGAVNGAAGTVRDLIAWASSLFDRFFVDGLVNLVALFLDNLSYLFRAVQDGLVQRYALFMLIGFFVMLGLTLSRWIL